MNQKKKAQTVSEWTLKSMPHDAFDAAVMSRDQISHRVACLCGASSGDRKRVAQFRTRPIFFAGGKHAWPISAEVSEVD